MSAATATADTELGATGEAIETMIPRRLDRLPWSRWHWLVVVGLGITWILDGFEVTLVGAIASALTKPDTLHLTTGQAASAGTWYLIGACGGALFFGYLTDRLGRKKLFMVTLGVYLVFTVATAFSWNFASFAVFRILAGAGIGGEYAAINSAIDELIPARVRGRVALAINGSWWFGTAFAAFISYELLTRLSATISWRLGFAVGAILALAILTIRRFIPESPRWLLTHGRRRGGGAGRRRDRGRGAEDASEPSGARGRAARRRATRAHRLRHYRELRREDLPVARHPRSLADVGQAFLYNAVFFTYTLVLTDFFNISADKAPLFLIPFAIGNILGPLLLGPLFDSIGRRVMISFTYITSGVLLIITGLLFTHDVLSATTMTIAWSVIFFFASAGASAAYLTVSELFPMEARAMAIALFYAVGTGIAALSPTLFGALIATKSKTNVNYGYLLGAALMIGAGLVAVFLAVAAERKSLEDVAKPLTVRRRASGAALPARAR